MTDTQPDWRKSRIPEREPLDQHLVDRDKLFIAPADPLAKAALGDIYRERSTIMRGLAEWLCSIQWPVDLPPSPGLRVADPAQIAQWQEQITEPIPAKLYENVFWGLTTDDLFQDRQYAGTLIGFTTEGSQVDLRGKQGANQQTSLVRVLVESAPLIAAEAAATRLWGLFLGRIGFTFSSGLIDSRTGARLPVQQPDFAVQDAKPIDEPQLIGTTDTHRAQFSFRLQTKYTRFL